MQLIGSQFTVITDTGSYPTPVPTLQAHKRQVRPLPSFCGCDSTLPPIGLYMHQPITTRLPCRISICTRGFGTSGVHLSCVGCTDIQAYI